MVSTAPHAMLWFCMIVLGQIMACQIPDCLSVLELFTTANNLSYKSCKLVLYVSFASFLLHFAASQYKMKQAKICMFVPLG